MNLVEEALTGHWGPKCSEYEEGCIVCDAWREYENLVMDNTIANEMAQVDNNMFIEELMRKPVDIAIRNAISRLIVERKPNDN